MCVCVCMKERERERESKRAGKKKRELFGWHLTEECTALCMEGS